MNLDREKRFHDLLARALDTPPDDRHAFLQEHCSEGDLIQEVLEALGAEANLGELRLPTQLVVSALDGNQPLQAAMPERIGSYRILELLGEGGMGRVYRAEQSHPVRRQVALKVLRVAAVGEALIRFEAERHAMGRLDHPNVGKILEAGTTPDGLPFFAMELIDGAPITTYCDQHNLAVQERLKLFVEVCRGVDHAHRKLLLHRDLKPSNILVSEVDGRPIAKLIDFGIAKGLGGNLTDATLATGNHLLGTPAYMSPEALLLGSEVDVRSDVFSLGVVLYELLAGNRPWQQDDDSPLAHLQRSTGDVVRPSTRVTRLDEKARSIIAKSRGRRAAELSKLLRGDLDWITLKAIDHDAALRYSSAADLAADIERHLNDEPVIAHAPTAGYLLSKLIRRHRGRVIAAALVAASLLLGVVGTTIGLVQARSEAVESRQARDRALQAQRDSAQLATYLKTLFGQADSTLENPAELTAREILERGSAALELQLEDQPRQRALLLQTVGEIYTRWDELPEAAALLSESLRLVQQADHGAGNSEDRAGILAALGELRFKEGSWEQALDRFDEALALLQPEGPHAVLRAAQLETKAASAMYFLKFPLEVTVGRLLRSLEQLEALPPATHGRLDALAQAYLQLGNVTFWRPDEEALTHYRHSLAAYKEAHGENSRLLVPVLSQVASWLVNSRRYDEAESAVRRSLELQQRLMGEETLPVARSLHVLGRILTRQEKYTEAEGAFRRSVEIRRALGTTNPQHANTIALLGYMVQLQEDGREPEAVALLNEAEEMLEQGEKPYPAYPAVLAIRARVELAQSRPEAAAAYLRRTIEYLRTLENRPHSHLSRTLLWLAELLIDGDNPDEARELCHQSLEVIQDSGDEEDIAARRQEIEKLGCLL